MAREAGGLALRKLDILALSDVNMQAATHLVERCLRDSRAFDICVVVGRIGECKPPPSHFWPWRRGESDAQDVMPMSEAEEEVKEEPSEYEASMKAELWRWREEEREAAEREASRPVSPLSMEERAAREGEMTSVLALLENIVCRVVYVPDPDDVIMPTAWERQVTKSNTGRCSSKAQTGRLFIPSNIGCGSGSSSASAGQTSAASKDAEAALYFEPPRLTANSKNMHRRALRLCEGLQVLGYAEDSPIDYRQANYKGEEANAHVVDSLDSVCKAAVQVWTGGGAAGGMVSGILCSSVRAWSRPPLTGEEDQVNSWLQGFWESAVCQRAAILHFTTGTALGAGVAPPPPPPPPPPSKRSSGSISTSSSSKHRDGDGDGGGWVAAEDGVRGEGVVGRTRIVNVPSLRGTGRYCTVTLQREEEEEEEEERHGTPSCGGGWRVGRVRVEELVLAWNSSCQAVP